MDDTFLSQKELARRWKLSPRSLERWRARMTGPSFIRLGGKIAYAMSDVVAYERRRRMVIDPPPIRGNW